MLLLDSNVVWWWATEPEEIDPRAFGELRKASQDLYLSVATIWELEIKQATRKLELTPEFWPTIEARITGILDIRKPDALTAARLPLHHRDPFDRMMIGQALSRGLTIVTRDAVFASYGVPVLVA